MKTALPTLNIVGAGHVGQTLGRLFHLKKVFNIQGVTNRSKVSAEAAVDFIGAGKVVINEWNLPRADVMMIATGDDTIADTAQGMIPNGVKVRNTVVFHCSGGHTADILSPLKNKGALTASVHPLKTFADITKAVDSFKNTLCVMEGDAKAKDVLDTAFKAIGGKTTTIKSNAKMIYHAGAVFACNYLTTLMAARAGGKSSVDRHTLRWARETIDQFAKEGAHMSGEEDTAVGRVLLMGLACCRQSGLAEKQAVAALTAMAHETLNNIEALGVERALTGPIARGSVGFVRDQLAALTAWNPAAATLYADMGSATAELSERKRAANPHDLTAIRKILHAVGPR